MRLLYGPQAIWPCLRAEAETHPPHPHHKQHGCRMSRCVLCCSRLAAVDRTDTSSLQPWEACSNLHLGQCTHGPASADSGPGGTAATGRPVFQAVAHLDYVGRADTALRGTVHLNGPPASHTGNHGCPPFTHCELMDIRRQQEAKWHSGVERPV